MKSVVVTSSMDRLTVTAASKQKSLKNVVAQDISSRRREGRQVVSSSFIRRLLNTISILRPFEGVPEQRSEKILLFDTFSSNSNTNVIEVQAPRLDVVLSELGVGQQLDSVGHQLHCFQSKCLKLEVDFTNLNFSSDKHTSAQANIRPECQKDSSGADSCSGTSYRESGSWLSCYPCLGIFQSK